MLHGRDDTVDDKDKGADDTGDDGRALPEASPHQIAAADLGEAGGGEQRESPSRGHARIVAYRRLAPATGWRAVSIFEPSRRWAALRGESSGRGGVIRRRHDVHRRRTTKPSRRQRRKPAPGKSARQ